MSALGFHLGRGVDVGDDRQRRDSCCVISRTSAPVIEAASEQPARRSGISTVLSGVQDLRRLGHEVDAGLDHDLRVDRPASRARARESPTKSPTP